MVANAGIVKIGNILDLKTEDYDEIMAVNARGVLFCYKYAAKQMVAQGRGGRIIGASSYAGKKGIAGGLAYSMSKHAVRGLTQSAGNTTSFSFWWTCSRDIDIQSERQRVS
ncbi:hypothetical protein OF83DRAFT_127135 [Amylostereum chailletii]|nr:hypothetical protein OF83DRAFT_127135 [Amylostereum chailletii]